MRSLTIAFALIIALALAVPQVGAAPGSVPSKPEEGRPTNSAVLPEAALETAPVEIDGQLLFRVRGASSYPAQERAAAITKRIESVAADRSIRSDALRLDESDDATVILAGNHLLMLVTDADAILEHVGRGYLANLHLQRIHKAIDDFRRVRSANALATGGLYALGATVGLIVALALLIPLGRRLESMVSERAKSRIHAVGIQSFEIVRREHIWKALHGVLYSLRTAVLLVLFFAYLDFVLSLFPGTRGLANQLLGLVGSALGRLAKTFLALIPDLFILVILYLLLRFVLRLLRHFFEEVERKRLTLPGFDAEWALPTYKMTRFALVAFGLIVAYPYIPGSESAAFKGVSLFIGVLFSLGSSTAISNIIAGYMITYRRVFKIGDRVKVGDVVGTVLAMRLQVTHILSPKHEEVTIPNSQILIGNVINFSSMTAEQGLILHTEVGIGYETPWRQVEGMLIQAAERTPELLKEPPPYVRIKLLGDFAVVYELNVYSDDPHRMEKNYGELHRQILDVFNEYGVQIMTPAYRADPPTPKLVPREQWYAAPAEQGGADVPSQPASPQEPSQEKR